MPEKIDEIIAWLHRFEQCVQKIDYNTALAMFVQDGVFFGSVSERMITVEKLCEQQWKKVWPNITGFCFDYKNQFNYFSLSQDMACVMIPWSSTGYNPDGSSYSRPGRMTACFMYDLDRTCWFATHTHFSLTPGTPSVTQKPST